VVPKEYFFVSDLHIGGDEQLKILDFEEEFVEFLKSLETRENDTELVIIGDAFGLWEFTFTYGHTHYASLRRIGERVVINTGTGLKKLERVPARFRLLPSVYHPSLRLNFFKISEDDGKIVIDYERIQKDPSRELSLLQRLVSRKPQRDALEDIPKRTVIG
jgi:hypothetical protein